MSEYQGRLEAICKHYKIGLSDRLFLREAVNALDREVEDTDSSVVHGHWVHLNGCKFSCSLCGREVRTFHSNRESDCLEEFPYCHCGAKMDQGEVK